MTPTTSDNIRAELARHGVTQAQLAATFDPPYAEAAISRRLAGSVEWRLFEVRHVAKVLDVPLSTLLTD